MCTTQCQTANDCCNVAIMGDRLLHGFGISDYNRKQPGRPKKSTKTLQHLCLPNPISNHATSHPQLFPSLWRTLGLCCFRRPLGWLFIIKTSTHVQLHFNLHLNDVSAVTGASSLFSPCKQSSTNLQQSQQETCSLLKHLNASTNNTTCPYLPSLVTFTLNHYTCSTLVPLFFLYCVPLFQRRIWFTIRIPTRRRM